MKRDKKTENKSQKMLRKLEKRKSKQFLND